MRASTSPKERKARVKLAIKLHEEGYSVRDIAKNIKVTPATITKYLGHRVSTNQHLVGKGIAKGVTDSLVPEHIERKNRRPVHVGDNKNTVIWVDRSVSDKKAIQRFYDRQEKLKTIK